MRHFFWSTLRSRYSGITGVWPTVRDKIYQFLKQGTEIVTRSWAWVRRTTARITKRLERLQKAACKTNKPTPWRRSLNAPFIARCDELYPKAYRGAGDCDLEEAIRRGKAYADSGADVLLYPLATQEVCDALVAELPVPLCVLGPVVPGTAFALHTGWGMIGAAKQHMAFARELMETGEVHFDHNFPEKDQLIEMDLYDALIRDWAEATDRGTR